MTDRKNATDLAPNPVTTTSGGILRPEEFSRHVELVRRPAPPEISRWVENYWFLRWDLAPGRWFASQVLPHPTCSLTVEFATHPRPEIPTDETVVVTGVTTTRFDVETRGWGRVAGIKFRPGGLAALTGRSAAAWTDRVVPVRELLRNLIEDPKRSVYEQVVCDSGPERAFVEDLKINESVKVYAKLPGWFKIPTPLGSYNPDWAVLVETDDGERLYFVVETKSTPFIEALRETEQAKIKCGGQHFVALSATGPVTDFVVASTLAEVLSSTA